MSPHEKILGLVESFPVNHREKSRRGKRAHNDENDVEIRYYKWEVN